MSTRNVTWTASATAGNVLPVIDGQISVDSTRNPQVSASLTLPYTDDATCEAFDPFTRAPVSLEIRQSNFVGGTLATFAQGIPSYGTTWTQTAMNRVLQPYPNGAWTNLQPTDTATATVTSKVRRAGIPTLRVTRSTAPTVPGADVNYPAAVLTTDSIPTASTGWRNPTTGFGVGGGTSPVRSASYSIGIQGPIGTGTKDFSGFVVGRSYTVTGWVWTSLAGVWSAIGIDGVGTGTAVQTAASTWAERTVTFTATATTHRVVVQHDSSAVQNTTAYWDDFTITRNAYTEPGAPVAGPNPTLLASVQGVGTNGTGTARIPVTASTPYNASVYFDSSRAGVTRSLWVRWYNSAGTTLSTAQSGAQTRTQAPGTWERVSFTATAPSTAAYAELIVNSNVPSGQTATIGDLTYITDAALTAGNALLPFFDGYSTSTDPAVRYRWNGTPGASTSVEELGTYGPMPNTLEHLDWSDKATVPTSLDGAAPAAIYRRLRMYVTDVSINETAGTFDVQLASADHLLTEMVNFGARWFPPIYTQSGDISYSYLNSVWAEFFEQMDLPLWTKNNGAVQGQVQNLEPWETGDEAWSYLNGIRTQASRRYVLNTATGEVTFPVFGVPAYATIDRTNATSVTVQRSVENSVEGVNQYADSVGIKWTDPTDAGRPDQWQFETDADDWRHMRRAYIEERDLPAYGSSPYLAGNRLGRMRRWRRMTTIVVPFDPQAAPFVDLTEHPQAESVQSIVFDYGTGDVTTTYLEQD